MNKGYSTAEAQQAFLNLPSEDQQVLELQHWIAADAMNLVYNQSYIIRSSQNKRAGEIYSPPANTTIPEGFTRDLTDVCGS